MPWGDGTGPWGLGPRTGRGLGYCAGFGMPGYMNPIGRGFGRGFRRRWFWRTMIPAPAPMPRTQKEALLAEKEAIQEEIKELQKELEEIKKRLAELK